jgi:hypothetical protein
MIRWCGNELYRIGTINNVVCFIILRNNSIEPYTYTMLHANERDDYRLIKVDSSVDILKELAESHLISHKRKKKIKDIL